MKIVNGAEHGCKERVEEEKEVQNSVVHEQRWEMWVNREVQIEKEDEEAMSIENHIMALMISEVR